MSDDVARGSSPSSLLDDPPLGDTTTESTPVVVSESVAVPKAPPTRRRSWALLVAAVTLAVLCGLLGALWQRAEADVGELRDELAAARTATETEPDNSEDVERLEAEVAALEAENERLRGEVEEIRPLLAEVPEGRLSVIDAPFLPAYIDEERNRLLAIDASGRWAVWGDGFDGEVTGTGQLTGSPVGMFAEAREAWIATDAGRIEVISITGEEDRPAIEIGAVDYLTPNGRRFWTFSTATNELIRLRRSDGSILMTVPLPEPITDLAAGAGAVWALGESGIVYSVNTADFRVTPIDAGQDVVSITAGPDALWALSAADGSLRRIDPVTGSVLVTVPVGRDPVDAVFADTSVWVGLRSGTTLIEVDTRTSAIVSRTQLPAEPTGLFRGASAVYVAVDDAVATLVRVASANPDAADTAADTTADTDG